MGSDVSQPEASALFGAWLARVPELISGFRTAQPFPHLVLDNFLGEELATRLVQEFPAPESMPRSRDYVFGQKKELSSVADAGPASRQFVSAILSRDFQDALSSLVGRTVFVDESFHGGGFHQGTNGSFLDFHVDFNVHPLHKEWLRVANVLLYLNEEWKPEYAGDLLIRSSPDQQPLAIAPLFNRAVVMVTDDHTFHGYRRMTLPPQISRKSIAVYAYALIDVGSIQDHTTRWVPESKQVWKRLLASQYDRSVRLKNRLLGSRTARNR